MQTLVVKQNHFIVSHALEHNRNAPPALMELDGKFRTPRVPEQSHEPEFFNIIRVPVGPQHAVVIPNPAPAPAPAPAPPALAAAPPSHRNEIELANERLRSVASRPARSAPPLCAAWPCHPPPPPPRHPPPPPPPRQQHPAAIRIAAALLRTRRPPHAPPTSRFPAPAFPRAGPGARGPCSSVGDGADDGRAGAAAGAAARGGRRAGGRFLARRRSAERRRRRRDAVRRR
jgi:hypothetical protein